MSTRKFAVAQALQQGRPEEALRELQPSHDLWTSATFQRWVKDLREEMEALKDAGLVMGSLGSEGNSAHAKILTLTGMDWPKNQEETLRLYLAFRAVLCFLTKKLSQLETESSQYEKLQKEQVQANGNIGIPRRAAR